MDLSSISPVLLIASLIVSATPIILAALGETVVEKAGVLNLGVEGMMITGAVVGFAVAINTENPLFGFLCAAIAASLLSLIFGILTQYLLSNQVATGLGLTMVGLGLSSLIGKPYEGMKSVTLGRLEIPFLSDIPIFGTMLFSHDIVVYFSIILAALTAGFLKYSRLGLVQGAAMDRRYDRRRGLDCACHCGLCQLETLAGSHRCLSFWRGDRFTA